MVLFLSPHSSSYSSSSSFPRLIHTGMFVSESKFRSAPSDFIPHIYSKNTEELASLITKPAVEAALLKRLAKKATFYGQELDSNGNVKTSSSPSSSLDLDQLQNQNLRIDVDQLVALYRDYIIPLTKEVEVSRALCIVHCAETRQAEPTFLDFLQFSTISFPG